MGIGKKMKHLRRGAHKLKKRLLKEGKKVVKKIGKKVIEDLTKKVTEPLLEKTGTIIVQGVTASAAPILPYHVSGHDAIVYFENPFPIKKTTDVVAGIEVTEEKKKLAPEDEPELFNPMMDIRHSLVQEIIELCKVNTVVHTSVIIWNISMLYGKLIGLAHTALVRTYFEDAETAIRNYVIAHNNQMTEDDFRKCVETNIDFAYERAVQLFD